MAFARKHSDAKPTPKSVPTAPIKLLFWHDVVVLIENGQASIGHYKMVGDVVLERGTSYADLGMLCIIARDAVAPGDDARRALNQAIARVASCLRCICWIVEGDGFQGAMVRAVLTGIRVFGKRSYPMHVTCNMTEGVSWIFQQLDGGPRRSTQVDAAVTQIQRRRSTGQFDKEF
jgi:hypothetical protein